MNGVKIFASCHNHSCFSDAEYTPETLARMAWNMGHGGIILTDHDTIKGYPFIKAECDRRGMKTLLGCEFSTYHNGVGTHLCGFDFDPEHPEMRELLRKGSSVQTKRTELLFKWGQERGTLRSRITWQDVLDCNKGITWLGNDAVFRAMKHKGIATDKDYPAFFTNVYGKHRSEVPKYFDFLSFVSFILSILS